MSNPVFEDRTYPPLAFGSKPDESDAQLENYASVGYVILGWATGEKEWPTTVEEFKSAIIGTGDTPNFYFPDAYTMFSIVQAGDDGEPMKYRVMAGGTPGNEFLLRLPPKGQVMESRTLIGRYPDSYGVPPLYSNDLANHPNQVDVFHARVADYTMRGCR